MDGFERKKMHSRESILNATEALLLKYGIQKVSISDIAGKAGVSQVTIYNLFGSKDNLVHECVTALSERLIEHFRELLKADKPYLDKIEDIVNYSLVVVESSPGLSDVDLMKDPRFRQLRDSMVEQERQIFLEFIKVGQQRGHLNPDLSEDSIVTYIEIIFQGLISNPELHARMHHDPKLLHDFMFLILYGFGRVK